MTRSSNPSSAAGPRPHTHAHPAPLPTPPLTQRGSSPSPSERAGRKSAPLFTLSPSALPRSDQPPEEEDISSIWNVVSRAADVVKDGERLENLAWRHWSDVRVRRRCSSSSTDTASSGSVHTPVDQASLHHRHHLETRRSFANKLKLLVEENSFKDWIEDAREHADVNNSPRRPTPQLTLPDTPTPNLEIRLVEPTPVPSRVGSLGGSLGGSTTTTRLAAQTPVHEERIAEETTSSTPDLPEIQPRRKRPAKGGFFIHQSPGKVSGASDGSSEASAPPPVMTSEPEPVAPAEEPQAEANGGPADSSQWRSSAESSSAVVVMKKKEPRRPVSMATMRGRFQAEKRLAIQAIAARKRLEQQRAQPEDDDDDSDWEDDDDETAAGSTRAGSTRAGSTRAGSTRAGSIRAGSTRATEAEDDEDDWEDEVSSAAPSAAPSPRNGRLTKKERAAAAARLEMEREAMRKRAMFAKKQIDPPTAKGPTEGLLSRVFRTGNSMIDLTQAGTGDENAAFRRTPTLSNLGGIGQSPSPVGGPQLLRSKSVVAMPVQSDTNASARSHKSGTSDDKRSHRSGTSDRNMPDDVELESSDEESEDDNYLASSQVRAKLQALDAKRAARAAGPPSATTSPVESAAAVPAPVSAAAMGNAMGEYNEYGAVAVPMSPTARRRMIIMREMSESLRRNIILEREKSSGPPRPPPNRRPPPSVHTHTSRGSAINLAQLRENARENGVDTSGFQRHSANYQEMCPDKALERHNSQPNLLSYAEKRSPTGAPGHQQPRQASVSPTEQKRRQNLLGHGFLRPLTRADITGINRTQSAAALNLGVTSPTNNLGVTSPTNNLGVTSPTNEQVVSPTANSASSGANSGIARASSGQYPPSHLMAPPMMRSSTEGDHLERERVRKRELQRRQDRSDSGYRFHGW